MRTLNFWGSALRRGLIVVAAAFALLLLGDLSLPQAASTYPFWARETAPRG